MVRTTAPALSSSLTCVTRPARSYVVRLVRPCGVVTDAGRPVGP
ncbi:hypothetical protein [Streptomyces azureus]|nr:hypothetical protein [Streptomyces azureus]